MTENTVVDCVQPFFQQSFDHNLKTFEICISYDAVGFIGLNGQTEHFWDEY